MARIAFRIFHDAEGGVSMLVEGVDDKTRSVKVGRPITAERLDSARLYLVAGMQAEIKQLADEAIQKAERIQADRGEVRAEIENALHPYTKGNKLGRALRVVEAALGALRNTLAVLFIISCAYKGIQFSSRHFPEPVHLVVLATYTGALALGIYAIATEKSRKKYARKIRWWFGPQGLLILPALILMAAAAVFASITFLLHRHGLVALDACRGMAVTEARLLDFYMWQFLNLVPFVKITETLKWEQPLCYAQSRVGLLILAFQVAAVIPCIATVTFYVKNRHRLLREGQYVYDPNWSPPPQNAHRGAN